MGSPRLNHDFLHEARFRVPHKTLYALAKSRAEAMRSMIETREGRIKTIRETNKITDAVMISLLEQAQRNAHHGGFYIATISNAAVGGAMGGGDGKPVEETVMVPVGVVGSLQAERSAADNERTIAIKMEQILAAIDISSSLDYELTLDDITSLGAVYKPSTPKPLPAIPGEPAPQ